MTDFDPVTYPIIAQHFFGIDPRRPIGEVAAEVVADLAFRRKVERLHGLGPRVVGELLAEIGAERGIRVIVERKIDKYAELEPETLQATGGDRFWPVPVREVRDG